MSTSCSLRLTPGPRSTSTSGLRRPRPLRPSVSVVRAGGARPSAQQWLQSVWGGGKQRQAAKKLVNELLDLVADTDRGLTCSAELKRQIGEAVDALAEVGGEQVTTDDGQLSATWKLLWTTEKETLFIVEKAGLFGMEAGEVYQVIDVDNERLQNVITFPPDGAFIVSSGIKVAGPQRVDFKFTSAKLKLPDRDIPFPPFGKGWFETVYVDDKIRVAKDVRGDTLIVARDGLPRVFE